MGNQVLRPSGPELGFYNTAWGVQPASVYWQAIDDIVPDGDTSYLFATVANSPFTVHVSPYLPSGAGKPTRVAGLLVMATIRTTVTAPLVTYRFRLRVLGRNYDSEDFTTNSTSYINAYKWYPLLPNGAAWTSTLLRELEIGLVFVDGDTNELRCTKMEAHVLTDAVADLRLEPVNPGSSSTWSVQPTALLPYQAVSGVWNGDLSYIHSSTGGDLELLTPSPLAALPVPNVEKVQVNAAVRTAEVSGASNPSVKQLLKVGLGSNFESGINDLDTQLNFSQEPSPYSWTLLTGEFYRDPSLAWPDSDTVGGPWTLPQLNNLQIGVENQVSEPVRCSHLALDVFLRPNVSSTLIHLPTSDSAQFRDIPAISPPQVPGNYYLNVDEDPPDDSGSYIGADAGTLGYPAIGTFGVGGGGVVPAGEKVWAVQSSCRVQLGASAPALVALCVNDASNELVIGRPRWINGTGATWFNLWDTWYTNPISGQKWGAAEPESMEWGVVILAGEAFISQVKVEVLTAPENLAVPDANLLDLTDNADQLILDSNLTGIISQVYEFGVGTGGFNPSVPTTVLPVVKADTSLTNEVFRASISRVELEDLGPGTRVTYWCRCPKNALVGNQVGEVGLYCRILWSIDPTWPIGTEILYAICHNPGQVIHLDDVLLFKLVIDYP